MMEDGEHLPASDKVLKAFEKKILRAPRPPADPGERLKRWKVLTESLDSLSGSISLEVFIQKWEEVMCTVPEDSSSSEKY